MQSLFAKQQLGEILEDFQKLQLRVKHFSRFSLFDILRTRVKNKREMFVTFRVGFQTFFQCTESLWTPSEFSFFQNIHWHFKYISHK